MPQAKKRENQPWLKFIVLPILLILFGLESSYVYLSRSTAVLSPDQQVEDPERSRRTTPTPTPTPTKYTCPKTAWVNCMPGPDAPERPQCSSEFYTWAKANCPDFEGLAY